MIFWHVQRESLASKQRVQLLWLQVPLQPCLRKRSLRHYLLLHQKPVPLLLRRIRNSMMYVGLSYAASPEDNGAGGGLRGLKQLNFPELASWSNLQCRKFLQDHGVLSDELPRCWGCLEPMSRTSRLENAPLKCETPACYLHPLLQCPREAWTPLHSQARQLLVVLSVFLDSKSRSPASFFKS